MNTLYLTALALYLLFIALIHRGLSRLTPPPRAHIFPQLSVILPVRNEQKHIDACLSSLAGQNYPQERYRVIVIDDASSDDTVKRVRNWCEKQNNFHLIQAMALDQGGISPKKRAIALGIKQSAGELIVTTDADCRFSPNWLQSMAASFTPCVGAVASWVHVPADGTWLSQLEELDSLGYSLVGAACIALGHPLIANGANFAYRRQAFERIGGFQGIDRLTSGDDDLLLQKLHKDGRWQIAFSDCAESVVKTNSCSDWKSFFQQRIRWASKSAAYALPVRSALALLFTLLLLVFFAPLIVIIHPSPAILLFISGKIASDYTILRIAAGKVGFPFRLKTFFAAELLQAVYLPIIAVWGGLGPFRWKDRIYYRGRLRPQTSKEKSV
ncbi:glycosyltransferase [candidate division KSB1 bacterium]|nr:glycosyltransferase [candidate division KSB1 bacterium]